MRPKDIEKHQKETRELLLQANPPLTAFGWAFLPLFDDVGQVKHAGPVAMRELTALKGVLTDEQLYDEINDPDRKTKTLTGHLALDVRRLGDKDELPNRFDTVLLPVKPFTQTERDPAAVRSLHAIPTHTTHTTHTDRASHHTPSVID